MEVCQVWILDIRVIILQVVPELHGRVGGEGAFGTVVHLHSVMLPRVENMLPDVLRTVGPMGIKGKVFFLPLE